ncbi:MAG: aminopeptidase P family protein [Bryobacteraceae bacterium]|nr:aminopeptidase P family protein [Bryobacteraceae bacterium]
MRLNEIQEALREQRIDAWLFFDHHRRDPLAYRILGLDAAGEPTRRWFYLIPAEGEPRGLVHAIEAAVLERLPGEKKRYASWNSLIDGLARMLAGHRKIAMQYSPKCAVPYISMVDAGTVELVRSLGVEVVSSADLVQIFEARWDEKKLASHLEAGRSVDAIRAEAFGLVGERLRSRESITEWELAEFIRRRFAEQGLTTGHGPIVAVNENSADPHYEPQPGGSRQIEPGCVLLIDLWAKLDQPRSVYYDITWTGYCGQAPPEEVLRVFEVVKEARDRAVRRVESAVRGGEDIRGFEVDDAARSYVRQKGYGEYFVHRTGHSIGEEVHGAGANMDNLETHDERRIIPWTCFSVEPGIYLGDFGIRSEVNVFVGDREVKVTGEIQEKLLLV